MIFLDKLITLEKRLYHLVISRLDGEQIYSPVYREKVFGLVDKGICGFIIFGGEREELKAFVDQIQSLSEVPLFIASDIERGVGQQIKGGTLFPCQMAVRAAIHRERPEEVAFLRVALKAIAHEAIDIGINLPLMPVLDVNQDPDNPIVCTRAFSDDPEVVSWFGSEYIKVLEGSGLLSCAKHFPGHGDTTVDSHISLPGINKSLRDLMDVDILSFKEAIGAGVSSIMVGHLHIPSLDSLPASLSGKVIRDLLRRELGFECLVLTDALNMSALSGIDNIPAKCIAAGVDVLLHPSDADLTVMELKDAIRSKVIDEGGIDAAIRRILKAKTRLGHIKREEVEYHHHRSLSKHITDMSITLVKQRGGVLPVADNDRVHLIIAGEGKFYEPSLWERQFRFEIASHPAGARNDVRGFDTRNDMRREILDKVAIIALFSEVAAWKGSSGIGEEVRKDIKGLIEKARGSVVISFGSPYVLRHFREADILIAAYEGTVQAQRAVIRCLKGELEFRGQLPVRL